MHTKVKHMLWHFAEERWSNLRPHWAHQEPNAQRQHQNLASRLREGLHLLVPTGGGRHFFRQTKMDSRADSVAPHFSKNAELLRFTPWAVPHLTQLTRWELFLMSIPFAASRAESHGQPRGQPGLRPPTRITCLGPHLTPDLLVASLCHSNWTPS